MRTLNIFAKTTLALAMVSGANGALAYFPADNDDSDVPAIFWSGASASSLTVRVTVISSVCDPDLDTLGGFPSANDIFLLSRSNYWAVACQRDDSGLGGTLGSPPALNGTALGPRIIVHKRDAGGSGVGVGPVQAWLWIDFMATTLVNCPGAPVTTDPPRGRECSKGGLLGCPPGDFRGVAPSDCRVL